MATETELHPLYTNFYNPAGELVGAGQVKMIQDPTTTLWAVIGEPGATKSTLLSQVLKEAGRPFVLVKYEDELSNMEQTLRYPRSAFSPADYVRLSLNLSASIRRTRRQTRDTPETLVAVEMMAIAAADHLDQGVSAALRLAKIQRSSEQDPGIRFTAIPADPLNQFICGLLRFRIDKVQDNRFFDFLLDQHPPINIVGIDHTPEGARQAREVFRRQATSERMQYVSEQVLLRARQVQESERQPSVPYVWLPDRLRSTSIRPDWWPELVLDPTQLLIHDYTTKINGMEHQLRRVMGLTAKEATTALNPFDPDRLITWDISPFLNP